MKTGNQSPLYRDVPTICGMAVTLIGALTMAGWLLHLPQLVQLSPGMAPVQFNTAIGFLIAGIGLACLSRAPGIEPFTGSILLILGLATLAEWATGLDLHIDRILFSHGSSKAPDEWA